MLAPLFEILLGFDWDEILVVCMAIAGVGVIVAELRAHRDHGEIRERVARLEANNDDSIALEGRLRAVEVYVEREERVEERIASLGERIAVLETRLEEEEE